MSQPIEHYALLSDAQSAALVGLDGSIDWLCLPRFDSDACFAALLGDQRHGCWRIAPAAPRTAVARRYRGDSLVLETEMTCADGTVRVVDCMPPRGQAPDVVRLVEGVRGRVPMRMELKTRFGYGATDPWLRRLSDGLAAVAGPDSLWLRTRAPLQIDDTTARSAFTVGPGERVGFVLTWQPAHLLVAPDPTDPEQAIRETQDWWCDWSAHCSVEEPWRDAVMRSLITLKALTYAPTGGVIAAATTSLPERIGGVRNWDYRYCWLRDATFTLYALMGAGYVREARAWRDWLLRAVAGHPSQMQIMYGPAGERRLTELELKWLPGYAGSRPVRIGNAAVEQFQLDVFGEVMDCLHQALRSGLEPDAEAWRLQRALLDYLESNWERPDEGIWEVRGPRRHFTHSKVMAWVAVDRAIKTVERFGVDGPAAHWRRLRLAICREVFERGYDRQRNCFTQSYGSRELDASLLLIPLVGFLPATDERMRGTVAAIERELVYDGFIRRYCSDVDGLPPGEGAFLACTFWLADNYALAGRHAEARALFERLLALRNDVGLLAEQYDPRGKRLLGNFPQAFSHVSLVNTARNLARSDGPASHRGGS